MRFRDLQHIAETIIANPAKDVLTNARLISKTLTKYYTGQGLIDDLEHHEHIEKADIYKIRKKLTKSTRDLMERVLRPEEKVFTAKGGVRLYGLPESQEMQFSQRLSKVRRGMSMQEWVQKVARVAAHLDPMSLNYTEIDAMGNAYPTYKSTSVIYDYALNGRNPEYVIFELQAEEIKLLVSLNKFEQPEADHKVYRVVDDANEYYVKKTGPEAKDISLLFFFAHPFGYVPGQINADNPVFNSVAYESDLMPVIELVAEIFEDDSTKAMFKKKHMHPKEWGPFIPCKRCGGEGVHDGEVCDSCGGSCQAGGIKISEKLAYDVDAAGTPSLPTPPGGYLELPIESWKMMIHELDRNEDKLQDTYWEAKRVKKTTGPDVQDGNIQTATGELMNERSKEPKLRKISKWAESVDRFQTDNKKLVEFGSNKPSTIVYGDRYVHGTPEELMEFYQTQRTKGAPSAELDRYLLDVIEAKFATNPIELKKHKVLMRLEPFVHQNVSTVTGWNIDPAIKDQKIYFSEWLNTMKDDEIVSLKEDVLRERLKQYAAQRVSPVEQPKPIAA